MTEPQQSQFVAKVSNRESEPEINSRGEEMVTLGDILPILVLPDIEVINAQAGVTDLTSRLHDENPQRAGVLKQHGLKARKEQVLHELREVLKGHAAQKHLESEQSGDVIALDDLFVSRTEKLQGRCFDVDYVRKDIVTDAILSGELQVKSDVQEARFFKRLSEEEQAQVMTAIAEGKPSPTEITEKLNNQWAESLLRKAGVVDEAPQR